MKFLKKSLKVTFIIVVLLLIGFYIFFVNFSSPRSNKNVLSSFKENYYKPIIKINSYKNFKYRVVAMQKKIDTNKTTIVFIHGAIGSALDFKRYLSDSLLNSKSNLIAYDRVGYNYNDNTLAQKSLQFEIEVLNDVLKKCNPRNTILIGYSFGGPIALGLKKHFKKIVLLAPAVYSRAEKMPWMLNFYKWRLTRWLVPHVWKSASEEKMTHIKELQKFEMQWKTNPSQIISIHGNSDEIVPIENSLFLQEQIPKEQFKLIEISNVGHSLVWTNFKLIKDELLKLLN